MHQLRIPWMSDLTYSIVTGLAPSQVTSPEQPLNRTRTRFTHWPCYPVKIRKITLTVGKKLYLLFSIEYILVTRRGILRGTSAHDDDDNDDAQRIKERGREREREREGKRIGEAGNKIRDRERVNLVCSPPDNRTSPLHHVFLPHGPRERSWKPEVHGGTRGCVWVSAHLVDEARWTENESVFPTRNTL